MKSPLAPLLIALLAALPAAAKAPPALPKIDPLKTYGRCNDALLKKAYDARADSAKVLAALGDALVDNSAKKLIVPATDNLLCDKNVWALIKTYEPQKTRFGTIDKLKEQLEALNDINKGFADLDTAVEKLIAVGKGVAKLGQNLGAVTIDVSTLKLKVESRGGATIAAAKVESLDRPEYTVGKDDKFSKDQAKKNLIEDADVNAHVEAFLKNPQPTDGKEIVAGVRVQDFAKELDKVRAAMKKLGNVVSQSDLGSKISDTAVFDATKPLQNTDLLKALGESSAALGLLDQVAQARVGIYIDAVELALTRVSAVFDARFKPVDGPAANPGGVVNGPATADKIEAFRAAFETKALQDIGAGAGGLPATVDRDDLKTAKAYVRDGKVIMITDKGLKVGEAPVPASIASEEDAKSAGKSAAEQVAAKFLKGDDAGGRDLALRESLVASNAPGTPGAVAGAGEVKQGAGESGCGDKRSTADRYSDRQSESCAEQGKSNIVERKRLAEEIKKKKDDCDADPFKKSQAAACKAKIDVDYRPRFEAMDSGKETAARTKCVATADSKVQEYLYTEINGQATALQGDYKGARADSLATDAGIPGKGKYLSGPVDGYFNTKWAGEEGRKTVVACAGKLKPSATAKTTEPSKENVDKLCVHDDLVAAIKASLSAVGSAEAAPLPSGAGDAGSYIEKETKFKPK